MPDLATIERIQSLELDNQALRTEVAELRRLRDQSRRAENHIASLLHARAGQHDDIPIPVRLGDLRALTGERGGR